MDRTDQGDRYLLCRIGSCIGALGLGVVRETMRPLPIAPLGGGAPPFVLGLAIVRGVPIPVIDAAAVLGSSESTRPGRFVSLKVGERSAALAVDAVLEIRSLPPGMLAETPPLLLGADRGLVSLVGELDAKLLAVLEAARLVPESVWAQISAAKV